MTSQETLYYTEQQLKDAYLKGEVLAILPKSSRITFRSRAGLLNGIVVEPDGRFKHYTTEKHSQFVINKLTHK